MKNFQLFFVLTFLFHFLSLWRMFASVDITIGAYGSIYFQSFTNIQPEISSQKQGFKKQNTLPTYPKSFFLSYANHTPFF